MKRRIKKVVSWGKKIWATPWVELVIVIAAGILLIYALLLAFKFIKL